MAKKIRVAMYSRVSTDLQNPEGQELQMTEYAKNRGWEVTRIYRDTMSGTKASRPQLDELMADANRRRMDVVLVWRFDRFARSVTHLLQALETFRTVGIEFASLSEQIDTSSPAGKLVFTILGAVAELERSLIVDRVRMGLETARRNGKRLGRPPIRQLSEPETAKLRRDRATGKFSLRRLAQKYSTSVWAVQQATAPPRVEKGLYEN